jgi:PhzF family phenazine biosynthesis protein
MQKFAHWTNLSETTFLLPPTNSQADYRVRIFFPTAELPFAGHPTLGSCHAWLAAGGKPRSRDEIVQECGVGLVRVRRDGKRLAFAAPPLRRSGDVDEPTLAAITRSLGLERKAIRASQCVDKGPGRVGLMLGSRDELLELKPDFARLAPKASGSSRRCRRAADAVRSGRSSGLGRTGTPSRAVSSRSPMDDRRRDGASATWRRRAALGTTDASTSKTWQRRQWIGGDSVTLVEGNVQL